MHPTDLIQFLVNVTVELDVFSNGSHNWNKYPVFFELINLTKINILEEKISSKDIFLNLNHNINNNKFDYLKKEKLIYLEKKNYNFSSHPILSFCEKYLYNFIIEKTKLPNMDDNLKENYIGDQISPDSTKKKLKTNIKTYTKESKLDIENISNIDIEENLSNIDIEENLSILDIEENLKNKQDLKKKLEFSLINIENAQIQHKEYNEKLATETANLKKKNREIIIRASEINFEYKGEKRSFIDKKIEKGVENLKKEKLKIEQRINKLEQNYDKINDQIKNFNNYKKCLEDIECLKKKQQNSINNLEKKKRELELDHYNNDLLYCKRKAIYIYKTNNPQFFYSNEDTSYFLEEKNLSKEFPSENDNFNKFLTKK